MIRTVAAFTSEFMTSLFRGLLRDQALTVEAVRAVPLALKTAHTANLYRLQLAYQDRDHCGPMSVIAKLPDQLHVLVDNRRIFQPGSKEEWFYRCIAPVGSITVPRCYFGQTSRETGEAVLLLEDLGQLEPVSQVEGVSEADIRLAITQIARFSAHWWNRTGTREFDELRRIAGDAAVGEEKVKRLFVEAWPLFVKNARFAIPDSVRELGDRLVETGLPTQALTVKSPLTLVHGDFRVDNLLFSDVQGARTCIVLDWEDVAIDCPLRDVAWLIAGCVPALSATLELALLKHYYDCLRKQASGGHAGYAFTDCVSDYRMCMMSQFVQGVLSGTIYHPEEVQDADDIMTIVRRERSDAAMNPTITDAHRMQYVCDERDGI